MSVIHIFGEQHTDKAIKQTSLNLLGFNHGLLGYIIYIYIYIFGEQQTDKAMF